MFPKGLAQTRCKDDIRVKAAIAWIRRNYTVTENPGQKDAGLYYDYHTFAKAMDALGEDPFVDAQGVKHDWRQELFDELKKRPKDNGSWVNSNGAFLEGLPELATAFAILAISYCPKEMIAAGGGREWRRIASVVRSSWELRLYAIGFLS